MHYVAEKNVRRLHAFNVALNLFLVSVLDIERTIRITKAPRKFPYLRMVSLIRSCSCLIHIAIQCQLLGFSETTVRKIKKVNLEAFAKDVLPNINRTQAAKRADRMPFLSLTSDLDV